MSLENKIELLTVAIERLTAMLEKQPSPKAETPIAKVKGETPAEHKIVIKEAPKTETITVDDLKSICTEIVRNNRDDKPKITALLDSFNAKTLSDLKPTDYADVKTCLEALKNV